MNRLSGETSPYLRQHAENPVDWYPWGEEAFAAARQRDRPILLSVGYSSCHWCHVMAHESFEDAGVAELMNGLFVNVKVDREERPDVDAVYMQAVQALTGQGGWPMTVFLAPDGRPFFGGTYFPKDDRPGMVGFTRLLRAIDEAWRDKRADLDTQAGKLQELLERASSLEAAGGAGLPADGLGRAVEQIAPQFDARFGGFGGAPKFPQAMTLELLLRAYVRAPDDGLLEIVRVSLDAMAGGGIYDHVGGGFHRYSVDAYWLVPHFEKMLYDQALLTSAYLRAYLVAGEARDRRVVEETIEYVLRDLRHKDGGFFSAEDADSEGVEGKFYLWSLEEIEQIGGADAADVIRTFGVTAGGNFEDPHTGYRGNILHLVDPTEPRTAAITDTLARLRSVRAQRVRPGLDDKVLLGWNALFLRPLAEAAVAFDRPDWMDAARANARFLLASLRRSDGRLLRSWQGGRANLLAYAEDYGALLGALISLAEVDDITWLTDARSTADGLLDLFGDDDGGFFTTGRDAEALIVRPVDYQDNAVPAANSLAADGLLRLAALTGEVRYEEPARRVLGRLAAVAIEHPTAFAHLLGVLDRAVTPSLEVAIVGPPDDPGTKALRAEVQSRLLPNAVTVVADAGAGADLTPLLAGRALVDGHATAYVCERFACRLPVTEPDDLRAQLDEAVAR
ncbi:MAG: thioredoxin domain-containing protein [Acidimicrobiia bacterium]